MKFDKLKTRRGKLEHKIREELTLDKPKIDEILKHVDKYEEDNLLTIDKLKKDKIYDTKRINGALRQTITAHGPITMVLIGSATKRIYGSLLSNTKKPRLKYTEFQIGRVVIEIILVLTILIISLH